MNENFQKKDTEKQKDIVLHQNTGLIIKVSGERISIIKKTEKITAALYLVSGLMPEQDPLKTSLRNASVELLSLINSLFRSPTSPTLETRRYGAETLTTKIETILSIMVVAMFSGNMSEMNYKILQTELELFAEDIKKNFEDMPVSYLLPEDLMSLRSYQDNQPNPPAVSARHIKDKNFYKGQDKGHTGNNPKNNPLNSAGADLTGGKSEKSARKEIIVSLLAGQTEMSIKDISAHMSGCSEKTIQRELAALIEEKRIKRKGERRWSTYSLSR